MTCRFSIVIATFNRAPLLADTLDSLACLDSPAPWEVIVVDNNSTDTTRAVVEEAARAFPVPLRYVHEPVQGRSAALNRGIAAAHGAIIVTTDDDVRVGAGWLDAIERSFAVLDADYIGGRVRPLWGAPRPRWLPDRGGHLWAVVALLDFGDEPLAFGKRVPLGVNMAFRREALERVGGFNTRIGRKAGTLLGQEVREWCLRARDLGVHGRYAPQVIVEHIIPADRLKKDYFRRWFYWRGVSRAMLYAQQPVDMEAPEQTTLDYTKVAHLAGVPRYMFRSALTALRGLVADTIARRHVSAFEHEVWLWFFAGIIAQRWRDRHVVPQWKSPNTTTTAATQNP